MLLAIRDRTSGWIAYVIVGLLVIPFALFGLYNYVGGGGAQVVATVDDAEITRTQFDQAYQQRQSELRRMLGDQYDPSVFSTDDLRRRVLEQLVDRQVLINYAQDERLRAADSDVAEAVRSQSAFQVDGRFSRDRYQQLLDQNGLTAEAYEAQIRRDLSISLLQRAVQSTAYTAEETVDRLIALQAQERRLGWVALSAADYRSGIDVSEAELTSWYEENRDRFREPESVRFRYIALSADAIAERIDVSESAVRERYDARASGQGEGSERAIRHILVTVPEGADDAAVESARERLAEARERIQSGEPFAAVAETVSDDTGSAERGGDLGVVAQDDLVDPFAEAAWSLEPGELSEPVRTQFGWHLIEVTDVESVDMAPFETVRGDLRQTIARERAERRVAELASEVEAVAFENPTTLEPAADAAGLDVRATEWINESSAEGDIIGDPGVLGTAFSDEAQERRENSELIELEDGGYAVIRVTDHRPSRIEPLQEVRDEARSAYRDERAAEAARADADRIAEAVNGGEAPARAADRIGGATYNEPRWSGRNDRSLPAGVRERGFRLPTGDGSGARAGVGRLPDGWAAVIVEAVRSGDPASVDDQRRRALRQTLNDLDAQASSRAVVAALRDRADIEIREQNF